MVGKSKSEGTLSKSKPLEDQKAWKATATHALPSYTMRIKPADLTSKDKRPEFYTIGAVTHRGTAGAAKWTIGAGSGRSNGIPKPVDQPGPGYYTVPSSMKGHPIMRNPRQVPAYTSKRQPLHVVDNETGPLDYQTDGKGQDRGRAVVTTSPSFTMRIKPNDPASREKRPECTAYTVKGGMTHKGFCAAPSWGQGSQSRSIKMKEDNTPAPGKYTTPTTFEGKHPLFPACARMARTETKRCETPPPLYPDRAY
jgi:hypothetical protein